MAGINAFAESSDDTCQDEAKCLTYCKNNLAPDGNPSADFCVQLFPDTFKKTACTSQPFVCDEEHEPTTYTTPNGCVEYSCKAKIPTYQPSPTGDSPSFDAHCKADIARSAQRIKSQIAKPIQAQLTRIARQRVVIPAEVTDDMRAWIDLLEQLKQLDDCGAILTLGPALDTLMRGLDEKLQNLSRLAQLPSQKKRLIAEFKRAETDWNKAKKASVRLAASSELIERGNDLARQIADLRVVTLAAMDDGLQGRSDALTQIEQGVEQLLELHDQLQSVTVTLNALVNARRQITTIERQYRRVAGLMNKRQRAGADIQELAACTADLKTALGAAQKAATARPTSRADVEVVFLHAGEVFGRCQILIQELSGVSSFTAWAGQAHPLFKPFVQSNLSQSYLGGLGERTSAGEDASSLRLYR